MAHIEFLNHMGTALEAWQREEVLDILNKELEYGLPQDLSMAYGPAHIITAYNDKRQPMWCDVFSSRAQALEQLLNMANVAREPGTRYERMASAAYSAINVLAN